MCCDNRRLTYQKRISQIVSSANAEDFFYHRLHRLKRQITDCRITQINANRRLKDQKDFADQNNHGLKDGTDFTDYLYLLLLDLAIELRWLEFIRWIIFQDFSLIIRQLSDLCFFPWFWLCRKLVLVIDISSDSYRIKHSGQRLEQNQLNSLVFVWDEGICSW